MNAFYAPLEQEALLHITGPDSLTFLQGQITCDTRGLEDGGARAGAYCTPQGRVVCDFLLAGLGEEHFAMRLRRDTLSVAASTFGKYIIFSKAELDDSREDWKVLACWGADIASELQKVLGALPAARFATTTGDGFVLVQTDEAGLEYECYLNVAARPELLQGLERQVTLATEEEWRCGQIQGGIGRIEQATSGEFIPQMLNYDLVGHISFNKGCYTGQEVVARLHYRGKAKRRMYLATVDLSANAEAGTPLYADGSQSVGNLVNSAVDSQGKRLALVVATADGVSAGLRLGEPEGPPLEILELPYPLEPGGDS